MFSINLSYHFLKKMSIPEIPERFLKQKNSSMHKDLLNKTCVHTAFNVIYILFFVHNNETARNIPD